MKPSISESLPGNAQGFTRASALAVLLACLSASCGTVRIAGGPPAVPADMDKRIASAVAALGHQDSSVREKASRELWTIGASAEAALQEASRSSDPEVAFRSRELLQKIESGIIYGMPDDLAVLVELYRADPTNMNARVIALRAEPITINARIEALRGIMRNSEYGPQTAHLLLTKDSRAGVADVMCRILRNELVAACRLLIARGDKQKARDIVRIGVRSGEQPWATDLVALSLLDGFIDQEIANREQSRRDRDGDYYGADLLVHLYRARGRTDQALKVALDIERVPEAGRFGLVQELFFERGDWKKLADFCRQDRKPGPEEIYMVGSCASRNRLAAITNEFFDAVSSLEEYGRTHPNGVWYAATALLLNDEIQKAIDLLVASRKQTPSATPAESSQAGTYGPAAELLFCQYRFKEALALADKERKETGRLSPDLSNIVARITAGAPAINAPKVETSSIVQTESNQLIRAESWPLLNRADACLKAKAWRMAADLYGRVATNEPALPFPLYLQGSALSRAGRKEDGAQLMDRASLLPLGDIASRDRLMKSLEQRGLHEDALRQSELILLIAPLWSMEEVMDVRFDYVLKPAVKKGDFATALRTIEQDRFIAVGEGRGYLQRSSYLFESARALTYRALDCISKGRKEEGHELLKRSVDVCPDLAGVLSCDLERMGLKEMAEEVFDRAFGILDRACEEYPRAADAQNCLAWLTTQCRKRLDDGLKHARLAVGARPQSAECLDTLAEVLFLMKDTRGAIELMRKCIKLDPSTDYFKRQLKRFQKGDTSTMPE